MSGLLGTGNILGGGTGGSDTPVNDPSKAPLASPAFTGVPTAPTAAPGTSTTQLATTAFSTAAAAGKADLAGPAFTGVPTAPTAAAGTSTLQLATTAFVAALGALKANLASPTFTGTPAAPTVAGTADSTTKIATTAFVQAIAALKASLAGAIFTGRVAVAEVALTDAANIATNAALGNVFAVTLAGNRVLDNPTNLVAGQHIMWKVKQDASASVRTLTYGSMFKWSGGQAPILTGTANALDILTGYFDGTNIYAVITPDVR